MIVTEKESNSALIITKGISREYLKEKLENLKPTPGFCISIDICHSTKIKTKLKPSNWLLKFYNNFTMAKWQSQEDNDVKWEFIKAIGDELMFYCPIASESENKMASQTITKLENYFEAIRNPEPDRKNNSEKDFFMEAKATVCYCENAYKVVLDSGFVGRNELYPDYLGLDIDRTFRIAKFAEKNSVIFDEGFKNKLEKEKWEKSKKWELSGPYLAKVKDFEESQVIYLYKKTD